MEDIFRKENKRKKYAKGKRKKGEEKRREDKKGKKSQPSVNQMCCAFSGKNVLIFAALPKAEARYG